MRITTKILVKSTKLVKEFIKAADAAKVNYAMTAEASLCFDEYHIAGDEDTVRDLIAKFGKTRLLELPASIKRGNVFRMESVILNPGEKGQPGLFYITRVSSGDYKDEAGRMVNGVIQTDDRCVHAMLSVRDIIGYSSVGNSSEKDLRKLERKANADLREREAALRS